MKGKKIFIVSACIVIVAALLFIVKYQENADASEDVLTYSPKIICKYYDEKSFMTSVKKAESTEISDLKVVGGITPHHLLADRMIAQFFNSVSTSSQKIVILIGPNHNRIGRERIQTGMWDWQTPFGILETEKEIANQIIQKTGAGKDINLLENEHSMAALIPYIKYYLPESQVVPIVLHGNLSLEESKRFANTMLEIIGDKDYIIVGSVDFSHYLPPDKTAEMDVISINAIEKRDELAISNMGNDNLDSPPTIITILEAMNKEGASGLKVLDHSNSSIISGTYLESNTSYYTLLFYKE